MTIEAYFQRHFPVHLARAATLGVSGTAGLSDVSAFVTLVAALGTGVRKPAAVALHEINPAASCRQRDNHHA